MATTTKTKRATKTAPPHTPEQLSVKKLTRFEVLSRYDLAGDLPKTVGELDKRLLLIEQATAGCIDELSQLAQAHEYYSSLKPQLEREAQWLTQITYWAARLYRRYEEKEIEIRASTDTDTDTGDDEEEVAFSKEVKEEFSQLGGVLAKLAGWADVNVNQLPAWLKGKRLSGAENQSRQQVLVAEEDVPPSKEEGEVEE